MQFVCECGWYNLIIAILNLDAVTLKRPIARMTSSQFYSSDHTFVEFNTMLGHTNQNGYH